MCGTLSILLKEDREGLPFGLKSKGGIRTKFPEIQIHSSMTVAVEA
jgi:hypothetical protein